MQEFDRSRRSRDSGLSETNAMTEAIFPEMARYRHWLHEQRGLNFPDYEALRQWSVRDIDAFWQSIWDYFDLRSPTPVRTR